MSSTYPILNDRAIDQLDVTELEDELKRRKLVTKGSKEDLINRLNIALTAEREDAVVDTVVRKSCETVEIDEEGNRAVVHSIGKENDSVKSDEQCGVIEPVKDDGSAMVDQEAACAESVNVTESVITEAVVSGREGLSNAEPQNGNGHGQDSVTKLENKESKLELEGELKPPCEHLTPNSLLPENQVSEVNPSLGSQVKSDSVNQKNELKDTIIANGVELEQEIVRSKMVEELSSRVDVPVYDKSHSMDVEEPDEKKVTVEENSIEDVGYPEKLNLDGSSDDNSMEEDMPESKQFDSKFNGELGEIEESVEMTNVKERDTVVVRDGLSSEGGTYHKNDIPSVSLVKKHKFPDQTSVGNNKPAKRQRWNSATAPMGEPMSLKGNSWSDSPAIDDAAKECIVPPSQRPPTNSLRINGFLRPFTLKAVQGLLGKTGNFTSFWMDEIKTHCYVSYTTVEEAVETRNAVYNLQWPPKVGRLLVAEYVEPQDVKMKLEPPPPVDFVYNDSIALPVKPLHLLSKLPSAGRERLPRPPPLSELPSPPREQLPPPPPLSELPSPPREWLPLPPPLSNRLPAVRERIPSPPPRPKKVDKPKVTIDDIFRKTVATPRIYYLPLSDEQVAAKLAAQGRSDEQ